MKLGGLGIRSIANINKVFHGKWIWRYLNENNSLWRKVIEIKWMKKDNDGRFVFSKRPHGTSAWKDILANVNELIANIHLQVGRGTKINFWHDSWCEERNLKSVFPAIYAMAQQKNLLVSEAFDSSDHSCVAVSRNLNDRELEEFENFLSMMVSVHLRHSRHPHLEIE